MEIVKELLIFLSLYLLPGLILSRLTTGKYRNNIIWWVFLSFIGVPFLYLFLLHSNRIDLVPYLLLLGLLLVLVLFITKKFKSFLDLDDIVVSKPINQSNRLLTLLIGLTLGLFFVMQILPRWGLWQGWSPVGDDAPRVGQVLSVAVSPNYPLHYKLPTTLMTVYYFHMIQPGLLTRFTDDHLKVHQTWFIHLIATYILLIWFINLIANYFARSQLGKFIMVFGLTFFSGLEYYLALFKNYHQTHLEWWAEDWFGEGFRLRMQVSSPFTSHFWVTQHAFALYLLFFAYMIIVSKQGKKISGWVALGILIASMIGNSIFILLAFALAYIPYYLIRIYFKKESLISVIKTNCVVGLVVVIFSIGVAYVFLESGKENYFVLHTNYFQFFNNSGLLKIVNFALTVPFYLTVELSLLFIVYIYYLHLFFKRKYYQGRELFLYLLTIPLFLIFIFRSKGGNNFSMRTTMPALTVLAIFGGWFIEDLTIALKSKWRYYRSILVAIAVLLLVPSTLAEFYFRYSDQFSYKDSFFTEIDEKLPFKSIVFVDYELHLQERLTSESHRLTFRPLVDFSISDVEYTSEKERNKYLNYKFSSVNEISDLLEKYPDLKNFSIYLLTKKTDKIPNLVLFNEDYYIYKVN